MLPWSFYHEAHAGIRSMSINNNIDATSGFSSSNTNTDDLQANPCHNHPLSPSPRGLVCHSHTAITLRFISPWDSYYHGVHDVMRLILTWGICCQKYTVTRRLMITSSFCHGCDHAAIRPMLSWDTCSRDDHCAISCYHKAQAAMILRLILHEAQDYATMRHMLSWGPCIAI